MTTPAAPAADSTAPATEAPAAPPAGFTQADVDRIVQERLARAKAEPPADYADLQAAAARLAEIEASQLTELEQVQARAEAAEKARDEAIASSRKVLREAAIKAAASRSADPDIVLTLLRDNESIVIGDDGEVTGAAEAVEALLAAKPLLVAPGAPAPVAPTPGSADNGIGGPPAAGQLTQAEFDRLSPAEISDALDAGRLANIAGL